MGLKFGKIDIPREISLGTVQINFQSKILTANNKDGYEFMTLKEIKIPENFKKVSYRKKYRKLITFLNTGEFIDEIIVNENNVLVDGYSTYTILREFNIEDWIIRRIS